MSAPHPQTGLAAAAAAAAPESQQVTDWAARIGWVVGLLLFVALLYWLMRQGWKWRGTLQGDLPELPELPAPAADGNAAPELAMTGRYHGSTTAGQWLDRIVAHGLGVRSRAALTLTGHGVHVRRPGARDFLIPRERLRGARLETGIAGKVLPEGGLLVITWAHGARVLDSGFRSDRAAEHPAWVERIEAIAAARPDRDAEPVLPAAASVPPTSATPSSAPAAGAPADPAATTRGGDSGVTAPGHARTTSRKGTP